MVLSQGFRVEVLVFGDHGFGSSVYGFGVQCRVHGSGLTISGWESSV